MSGFYITFLSYGPYFVKICALFSIFADFSKRSKTVIAMYVYVSENSRLALLEYGIGYYAMT